MESGMGFGRALKRQVKAIVTPVVFLVIAGYFLWSATQGAHGLRAYALRQVDLANAQADLQRVQQEQVAWERRVSALRSSRLDLDALDERARAMLNLAEPSDIVVPLKSGERIF
jgi:cell division protein FtsB